MTVCTMQHQYYLDLGSAANIELIHRNNHNHGIHLIEQDSYSGWHPIGTMSKEQAIALSLDYEESETPLYMSLQPLVPYRPRRLDNVVFLSNFYVDLDIYKTEFSGLTLYQLLEELRSLKNLPLPTIAGSSGRGFYLVWCLESGVPKYKIPVWQQIENNLIAVLSKYGADPRASDASRVFRQANSYNPRSGTRVDLKQVGKPVSFAVMKQWCDAYEQVKPKPKVHKTLRPKVSSKSKSRVVRLKTPYSLAYDRMQDLIRLSELRGGKYSDCRNRAMFVFACTAAWFVQDEEYLKHEVDCFIDDHFIEPEKYKKRSLKQVFERFSESKEGKVRIWKGQEVDPRYKFSNQKLLDYLDISEEEQRHLLTIISREEKNRRRREKRASERRSEGIPTRSQYLGSVSMKASENCSEALRMRASGMPVPLIAAALRVSKNTVYRYFKEANKIGVTP